MTKPKVKPALGFSAAKLFRKESQKDFVKFLHRHLFFLASTMQLIGTGGTVKFIKQLLKRRRPKGILFGPNHLVETAADYKRWKHVVEQSLTNAGDGTQGMVAITNGVVEETIAAIHHFTDREDIEHSIYARVLARQAIVHRVPIANDLQTASAMATAWLPLFALGCPFQDRDVPHPLEGLAEGGESGRIGTASIYPDHAVWADRKQLKTVILHPAKFPCPARISSSGRTEAGAQKPLAQGVECLARLLTAQIIEAVPVSPVDSIKRSV